MAIDLRYIDDRLYSPGASTAILFSRGKMAGIAWDASEKRLFVTGKLWPKLFEIRVVP
jgi:glutaminyl-peptide cyclotransferase